MVDEKRSRQRHDEIGINGNVLVVPIDLDVAKALLVESGELEDVPLVALEILRDGLRDRADKRALWMAAAYEPQKPRMET